MVDGAVGSRGGSRVGPEGMVRTRRLELNFSLTPKSKTTAFYVS